MSSQGGIEVARLVATLGLDAGNLDSDMAKAQQALKQVEAQMKQLTDAFNAGSMGTANYWAQMQQLIQAQNQLQSAIPILIGKQNQLATATTAVSTSMGHISKGSGDAAQGMLRLGYAIDDLQYGLSAVVNNVPGLLMGFGAGAGLAGTVAIAAVGVNVLVKHWGELTDAMGLGAVQTEADRMEALGKQTHKTAEETALYNKYKKEEHDIAAMLAGRSKEDRAASAAAQEAFNEADPMKVQGLVMAMQNPGGLKFDDPAKQAELETLRRQADRQAREGRNPLLEADAAKDAKAMEDELRKEAEGRANKLMNDARENPGGPAMQALVGLLKSAPKDDAAVKKGLIGDLENANPAAMRKQADLEAEGKLQGKHIEDRQKLADETEKAAHEDAAKAFSERADRFAKALFEGPARGNALAGLNMTKGGVAASLMQSGVGEEEAGRFAEAVLNRLNKNVADAVERRGLDKGMGKREAELDLIKEARQKEERDAQAKADAAARRAQDAIPGIGQFAEAGVTGGRLAGAGEQRAADATAAVLKEALKRKGFDDQDAGLAAAELAKDANKKVDEKLAKEQLDPDQQRRALRSETVDIRGFQAKVQAGVAGQDDVPKKQLAEQTKTRMLLEQWKAEAARNGGPALGVN